MKILEFEHVIQINEPVTPRPEVLNREQLWQGLVFRCKYPRHFNPAILCSLEAITDSGFVRHLRFGAGQLSEQVGLLQGEEIRTSPLNSDQPIFARSITRIEEQAKGHLAVRFMYWRESGNTDDGMNVDDYLKAAYVQNDHEAIRLLRHFAMTGFPLPHGSSDTPSSST
jgi:hypothetical protein